MRRAKHKAAAEGRTLTSLIEDALRRVLSDTVPTGKPDRKPPPVSKATGGLRPGIDLDDSSAIQEIEDLEYAKRLL